MKVTTLCEKDYATLRAGAALQGLSYENDPLITRKEAQSMFGGVSRRTIWEWEKKGKLPPPIRLSTRVIGWRKSTLEELLQSAGA